MKKVTAIPYENGQVFGHFGKTQAFLIAELETGKIQKRRRPDRRQGAWRTSWLLKAHGGQTAYAAGWAKARIRR
ncbi:MAG: NifB/NifX family molybdenum-iron cluster-binding protein [Holdemania massiliensis]